MQNQLETQKKIKDELEKILESQKLEIETITANHTLMQISLVEQLKQSELEAKLNEKRLEEIKYELGQSKAEFLLASERLISQEVLVEELKGKLSND